MTLIGRIFADQKFNSSSFSFNVFEMWRFAPTNNIRTTRKQSSQGKISCVEINQNILVHRYIFTTEHRDFPLFLSAKIRPIRVIRVLFFSCLGIQSPTMCRAEMPGF
jgi:hypothetical protein